MARSFTLAKKPLRHLSDPPRVLVTGAAGNIGSYFAQHSHGKYKLLLMVRGDEKKQQVVAIRKFGDVVKGDITNLDRLSELCEGVDTVLHLAAAIDPSATWDQVLPANIVGTYNVFAAAKSAKCRRVVYASSIHAVSGHPADMQAKTSDPVNPGDLYGVSKCFGEAMARYMAEKEGVSAIALRIGVFQPLSAARDEGSIGMLDAFVSKRDLNQMIEKCIDDTKLQFAIFNGLSDNRFKRLDISDARELIGYQPKDDLTRQHPKLKALGLAKQVRSYSLEDAMQKSGLRKDVKPIKARGKMR